MNDSHAGSMEFNVPSEAEVKPDRLILTERQQKNYNIKVDKSPHPNGCWVWTGNPDKDGYGRFRVGKHTHRAHRVSFMVSKGVIPDEMLVCHKCDNPPCCNPDHLWVGTISDNNRDSISKGRAKVQHQRGEANATAILNDQLVRSIRSEYAEGLISQRKLGLKYNVSLASISFMLRGKTWIHVI